MVWGAISQTRKYPLIRVRGTLNAQEYISQILTPFLRAMPRASRRKPRLMQDGATCHTAVDAMTWLDSNNVENAWAECLGMDGKETKKASVPTHDELWEAVKAAWDAVSMKLVKTLYESMPRRLKMVRKSQGNVMMRRRVGQGRDSGCTRKVVKFGGGDVMVWGSHCT